jgi:hypothetical protein
MSEPASTSLRALKSWEGNGPLVVLNVSAYGGGIPEALKRFYLVIDANQRSAGVRAVEAKPEDLKPGGAIVGLLRKHARTGGIGGVWRAREGGDWWVPLFTSRGADPDLFLRVAHGSPPEVQLVTREREVLARKSSQGTYTKRRTLAGELPRPGDGTFDDVTQALLDALAKDLAAADARAEPLPGSSLAPESLGATPRTDASSDAGDVILPEYQRAARDRLGRKLKTLRKSVAKTAGDVPDRSVLAGAERDAELLRAYLYRVREGDTELLVPAHDGAGEVRLELSPDASPGRNLELAFERVKKLRRALEIGGKRLQSGRDELAELEADVARVRAAPLSESDVERILSRHKLSARKPEAASMRGGAATGPVAQPWKTYVYAPPGEPAIELRVGKSAADNDELCKAARHNDYWVHVVGITGSHVIIPARQLRSEPALALLRLAAVLALHYSRLKDDRAGEVYVTRRQHIRKRKGMPPGLWQVDQAETMFVRYDDDELKRALDMLVRGHHG